MSDCLRPHGLQPTRLLCPWASPGKNTGVGCHLLLRGIFPTLLVQTHVSYVSCIGRQVLYHQSHLEKFLSQIEACMCSIVSNSLRPHGLQPARSSVPGIFQARILERAAISYSWKSSWPRDLTHISCIGRWIPYHCLT